jgi:hypothetical protein
LSTTVGYLVGITNQPGRLGITPQEGLLLDAFRELSQTSRNAVLETIKEAAGLDGRRAETAGIG